MLPSPHDEGRSAVASDGGSIEMMTMAASYMCEAPSLKATTDEQAWYAGSLLPIGLQKEVARAFTRPTRKPTSPSVAMSSWVQVRAPKTPSVIHSKTQPQIPNAEHTVPLLLMLTRALYNRNRCSPGLEVQDSIGTLCKSAAIQLHAMFRRKANVRENLSPRKL